MVECRFEIIIISNDEPRIKKVEERLNFVLESMRRSMSQDGSDKMVRVTVKKDGVELKKPDSWTKPESNIVR